MNNVVIGFTIERTFENGVTVGIASTILIFVILALSLILKSELEK